MPITVLNALPNLFYLILIATWDLEIFIQNLKMISLKSREMIGLA